MRHSQDAIGTRSATLLVGSSRFFLQRLAPEALVRSFVGAAEEAIASAGGAQSCSLNLD